jgi:hypothetical protein
VPTECHSQADTVVQQAIGLAVAEALALEQEVPIAAAVAQEEARSLEEPEKPTAEVVAEAEKARIGPVVAGFVVVEAVVELGIRSFEPADPLVEPAVADSSPQSASASTDS